MRMRLATLARVVTFTGALLTIISVGTGAAFQAASDLAGHWALDETDTNSLAVSDSSSYGNSGTRTPTNGGTDTPAVISTDVAPIPGNPSVRSILCNADTDRPEGVEIFDKTGSSLNLTGPMTISVWIKLAATGPTRTDNMGVVERLTNPGAGYSGYFLRLYRRDVGGTFVYIAGFTTSNSGSQSSVGAPDTSPIPRGVWTHVAAVYDGTNLSLYQNGTSVASGPGGAPGSVNTSLSIGNDKGVNRFHGNVDEVRMYNRALSGPEINVLINGQPPVTGLTAIPDVNRVDLSWTAPAGATSYIIERGDAAGGPFLQIGTSSGTSFSDNTPTFPNTYWYRVIAVSVLQSTPAGPVSASPLSPAPRIDDHEEGFLDGGKCSCGTTAPASTSAGLAFGLLLLSGLALLKRR